MRALLVLSIFLLCSCGKPRSFYVPPAADDVIEISVSFFDPDAAVPSVIERVMTEEQTQDFLKSVSMGYRDREPRKWQVMGDLFMKTRSEEIPVGLFYSGGKVGAFEVDGNYYRGGSDAEFEALMREVAKIKITLKPGPSSSQSK